MVTFNEKHVRTVQKKCNWARYNYVGFFPFLSMFLVAPLRFCCRKLAWKSKFSEFFYLFKRLCGGCFQWNRCIYFQMIWSGTSCIHSKFIRDTPRFLVAFLPFCLRKLSKNLNFKSSFLAPLPPENMNVK